MKLSTKLALALGTVLAAVLAAANTWTLERQFSADLSAAQAEATRAWTLAARTVQREGADRSLFNVLIALQVDGAAWAWMNIYRSHSARKSWWQG